MKEQIFDFFKGIVIGIANVIPGLSGGTIAVVLNIYHKFVNSLKYLLSHPFKTIKDIWGLLLGIVVGIIISVKAIQILIETFPIPTMMLFVGLIIGAIPKIYQNIKDEKKTYIDIIVFIGFIVILIGLPFIPGSELDININLLTFIVLFLVGLIAASAMVIPGISGSMMLMIFGYYVFILNLVNNFLKATVELNFGNIINNLFLLIPFALGVLLGIVFISNLISRLIVKYGRTFYCAILGLLIASPFVMIYSMVEEYGELMKNKLLLNIIIG
ncbi:MAG TPA: DUF368 domain-containing protein, partial [Acholeplasmataceae bacterium]|nr:DUF368 domain-containing protein [Acholeplasmataceae bacterium]